MVEDVRVDSTAAAGIGSAAGTAPADIRFPSPSRFG
jgi:hypothetical protein